MGVCIQNCNTDSEKILKESYVDCSKKTENSIMANVITSNNLTAQEKKYEKMRFRKMFNNNKEKMFQQNNDEQYIKNVIKIQMFYRNHIRLKRLKQKKEKEKEKEKELEIIENSNQIEKEKEKEEDTISLKMNIEMVETFFSSNSLNNSNISKENNLNIINNNNNNNINNDKALEQSKAMPFNIKAKLTTMQYKYSGYMKKIYKSKYSNESKSKSNNSEVKDNIDNTEENLIKEGFGKFLFKDGSEFCGIFRNNVFQTYGKYLFLNNKENNTIKSGEKEIIITDTNINYEEFIGEYKNYIPDGFGIYTNLITNLKITGIFGPNGIMGIGVEHSVEGGYTYYGEFKNNKKEGIGTIIWKDGSKYQGQFVNNLMNGYGMIEFPEKNFYQGEMRNGKMDGYGQFFWADKRKYIGNYKNDKRNGFGVYLYKTNESYIDPEFDNEFDMNNSSAFVGFWKNGVMDGFGMVIQNKQIKYGIWESGFKKKSLEDNTSLISYAKWMNKKYNRLFIEKEQNIFDFLNNICDINREFEFDNSSNSSSEN